MATIHENYHIDNHAVVLIGPSTTHYGANITVQNYSDLGTVYLGGPNVSVTSWGVRLRPNEIWQCDLGPNDTVYAIGSQPMTNVAVMIVGNDASSLR